MVITYSPVLMEQENSDELRKKADKFESQYSKLKQEFKDYIEVNRKNEEKKRVEIKTDLSRKLLTVADSLTRITGSDNEQTCEMMKNYSDNLLKNIEAVYNQMLYASGLTPIEPGAGDKFSKSTYPNNKFAFFTVGAASPQFLYLNFHPFGVFSYIR